MAAGGHSSRFLLILAVTVAIAPCICVAQEVGFIDLTQTTPTLDLRRPTLTNGEQSVRRITVAEKVDCGPPNKDAGALQTTLVL